jgi:hypothetical protein
MNFRGCGSRGPEPILWLWPPNFPEGVVVRKARVVGMRVGIRKGCLLNASQKVSGCAPFVGRNAEQCALGTGRVVSRSFYGFTAGYSAFRFSDITK